MWWHTNGGWGFNSRNLWVLVLIFALIGLMVGWETGRGWWFGAFLIFIFVLPRLSRRAQFYAEKHKHDDFEKPKHDTEKPKRYVEDSAGETLEVIQDEPPAQRDDDTLYA